MNTCVYSLNKKRIAFQQSDRVYNHLHALIYASTAQYKVLCITNTEMAVTPTSSLKTGEKQAE
jgi:hypothetical protein